MCLFCDIDSSIRIFICLTARKLKKKSRTRRYYKNSIWSWSSFRIRARVNRWKVRGGALKNWDRYYLEILARSWLTNMINNCLHPSADELVLDLIGIMRKRIINEPSDAKKMHFFPSSGLRVALQVLEFRVSTASHGHFSISCFDLLFALNRSTIVASICLNKAVYVRIYGISKGGICVI